jgi:phosphoribosyl 1,2-cyclic phosphate phosphodiesterase
LRPINFLQKKTVQVFSDAQTLSELKRVYPYVFDGEGCPSDVPKINHKTFNNRPFKIGEVNVIPIPLLHGNLPITGFRVGSLAYCTDVSFIPNESYDLLKNLDVLILGALRDTPHPTHFNLKDAEREAEKIGAKQTYFVHMSHELSHFAMLQRLPSNMAPAYDGLQINLTNE